MENNIKFKQDLEDFIRDRIEESYSIIANKKEYQELNNKCKKLETKFIKALQSEDKKEFYQKIRDIRMELDYQELQEAYLIGFRDSTKINNNNLQEGVKQYANKRNINQSINQSIVNQGLQDFYLKEVNEIIDYTDTHFYINITQNPIQYGIRINIKDIDQMQEIITQFKTERKAQIEAWNEEQRQRNLRTQNR